ncbi:MAG: tetratricopeptide repeat protein [Bacteroidales bacterium]
MIRALNLENQPYEARHVMVALTGAAAMLTVALFARNLAGYGAACLALLLMFCSPRFLGHSFNNPLDVPFAFGTIFTLYQLYHLLRALPRIRPKPLVLLALGIGWTNGIRIGGLVLIPYLFLFSGLYLIYATWPWKKFSAPWWKLALHGFLALSGVSLAGYVLSLLTWPYALQDAINHPLKAFQVMSNIQVSIRVVYDGMLYWSDHLPWHYIPKNIALTVPVLILSGVALSLAPWPRKRDRTERFWVFVLWFTVLFPIFFIIKRESNVYGGWRHMMFVYPSMVTLAALALSRVLALPGKAWLRGVLTAAVLLGLLHPVRHILRNHPNTYIYFNEWSGGINRCQGRYETDYYTSSLKPASDHFISDILPGLDKGGPVRVVSNGSLAYYFRNHESEVTTFYSRYYDRGKYDWDYAILYCNYLHPYQITHGMWPPKNTIHTVRVDSVVVAAIVERKDRNDFLGTRALEEGMMEMDPRKINDALVHLERAVAFDDCNEAAYLELGNTYAAFLRFEDARRTMDKLLSIYPDYDKAYNLKGYTYLIEAEVRRQPELIDEAIRIINQAIRVNYKFHSGYYNLGLCYEARKDFPNAEYYFKEAIKYNGTFRAAYEKLAGVYEQTGNGEALAQVRLRLQQIGEGG